MTFITEPDYIATPAENLLAAPNRLLTPMLIFIIISLAVWIYWPAFVESRRFWPTHSDDWHYWLIPLLSLTLLWVRRDTYPAPTQTVRLRVSGILLIGTSAALLVVALATRMPMLAGASLVAWVAGVVWLLGGFQLLRWAWPSVILLAFVIPVPQLLAYKLSAPLQKVSASVACYLLQVMQYHAIEVGPTVVLGAGSVNVASYHVESCVLHSTLLIGFASLMIRRRTLIEVAFHVASVLPILVVITATRVAAATIASYADIGIISQLSLVAYARWAPVPMAVFLFASLIAYFAFVSRQVEHVEIDDIIPSSQSARWEPIR